MHKGCIYAIFWKTRVVDIILYAANPRYTDDSQTLQYVSAENNFNLRQYTSN